MTTSLGEDEFLEPTSSNVINNLLSELNAEGCGEWRVSEHFKTTGYLWKRRVNWFYLYGRAGSEWQIINVVNTQSSPTFGLATESELANWINGMLCGIDCERRRLRLASAKSPAVVMQ